jgi:hypothetical protein
VSKAYLAAGLAGVVIGINATERHFVQKSILAPPVFALGIRQLRRAMLSIRWWRGDKKNTNCRVSGEHRCRRSGSFSVMVVVRNDLAQSEIGIKAGRLHNATTY